MRPGSRVLALGRRDPAMTTGLVLLLAIATMALVAPALADPNAVDVTRRLAPPSMSTPMGTDHLGRDELSRVMHGARTSFAIAALVVTLKVTIGMLVGAAAGYLGRLVDATLMRATDLVLAFPGLVLALVITALLGPSTTNLALALAAVGWVTYARLVRATIRSTRAMPFVEASTAIGCRDATIVTRHILPHLLAPLLVLATLDIGHTILAVSSLSFLGLGIQPPTPEWGAMLTDGKNFMETAPHLMIFPGLMIVLSVLAFNLLTDSLRDALDPRAQQRVEV
ncbi:MAG: ABC transporter permease [Egibacteraceae bacterium]